MKPIKSIFSLLFFFLSLQSGIAQNATELHATGRSFMQQGDYANAIVVLNRATQIEPENIEITKDLSLSYYMQRDNNKALETIKPVLDRADADDQCYQIAGNIYLQLGLTADCNRLYRAGIKRFPESGSLYNELGVLLWEQKDNSAINLWEKGIETDPNYSKNYYNACKYYNLVQDKVWCILYGEIFVDIDPLNTRTTEIKAILLENYKKLFADIDIAKGNNGKNKFTTAFIETINKQSSVAAAGINAESLTMIRTRFILDWYKDYAAKFPFKLFDLHKQLLEDGMFDAYNQWLFGSVQNLAAYQNWTITHSTDYNEFNHFQKGRIFKLPPGQYYRY
jgi:tetratricopeptide (TPR) repeat protein